MKGKPSDFNWVAFPEHPIVNFQIKEPYRFDISLLKHPNLSSDFRIGGKFSHRLYCLCVIEHIANLMVKDIYLFLDYQCAHIDEPRVWLKSLTNLIMNNKQLLPVATIIPLLQAIGQKRELYDTHYEQQHETR